MTDRHTRLSLLLVAAFLIGGCGDDGSKPNDDNNDPPDETPTYTADVRPILLEGCGCHQPGGPKFSTVPLDTYANVFARRERVKARAGVEGTMPPTGALPQGSRQTIIAWVEGGGPQ